MILETERLRLRELTDADVPALSAILQNAEAMVAYEGSFTDAAVRTWLERQQERYRAVGFGLWAVELRESGEMVGQTGLTLQSGSGVEVLEVGYLFRPDVWHRGLATEAAAGCVAYGFDRLGADAVHAQVRDINLASMNVAIRLGMTVRGRFVKRYRGVTMPHLDFAITREVWSARAGR